MNQRHGANVGLMRFSNDMVVAADIMKALNDAYNDETIKRHTETSFEELSVFNDVIRTIGSMDEEANGACIKLCLEKISTGLKRKRIARHIVEVLDEECLRRHALGSEEHVCTLESLRVRANMRFTYDEGFR